MPRLDAIDISHHNTITRFDRLPPVRLMAHKVTEGQSFVDPMVRERWPRLRERHELMCGYHWVRPDSDMRSQAEHHARVMEELGWEPGVFTQLDWERTHSRQHGELRAMEVDEIAEWCEHHARLLGEDRLIVYVNPNVDPSYHQWRAAHPDVPHWLPNYSTSGPRSARELSATIHQWTASFTHDGFTAGVDANEVLDWATIERIAEVAETSERRDVVPTVSPLVGGFRAFKFSENEDEIFASGDGLTAVLLHIDQWRILVAEGARFEVVDRSVARRYTFVGGAPPERHKGIWANA